MIFQVLSTTTTSTMIVSWRGLSSVKSNRWLENGQQEIIAFLLRRKFVRNYNKFIDVISNANMYLSIQQFIHIKEFSPPKKKYKLTDLLQHNGIFSKLLSHDCRTVSFLIPLFMGKTSTILNPSSAITASAAISHSILEKKQVDSRIQNNLLVYHIIQKEKKHIENTYILVN